jgi:prepilin-type N-terminal cleavage/methylation domain-containing protein
MSTRRRGFTLVEILIAMLLTTIVTGAVYRTIVESRRLQRTLYSRMDTAQSARTTALFLGTALRELDAFQGDLVARTDTSVRYRAARWTGLTCTNATASGGDLVIGIRNTQLWGAQLPTAGQDSIFLYLEVDPNTRNDDRWVIGVVSAVGTGTCADAAAATTVTFSIRAADGGNTAVTAANGFRRGGPMRGFQHEEVTMVPNGGLTWVGRRTMASNGTWTTFEPVVGPIMAATGLNFALFDSLNTATTTVTNAASLQLTVRALSREIGWRNGINARHVDSIVTRIALRNNSRF